MNIKYTITEYNGIRIAVGSFTTEKGITEHHVMFHVLQTDGLFEEQSAGIISAYRHILAQLDGAKPVFKRYFLSDAANQLDILKSDASFTDCACSVVQQPPLDGSKVALWAYFQTGVEVSVTDGGSVAEHNGYRHIWTAGRHMNQSNSYVQTEVLLDKYVEELEKEGCTLENDCIRTWFFVQNVDANYNGVVYARKKFFEKHNLTHLTHYIASTGIEGRYAYPDTLVLLDAYAVKGLQKEQQRFLYASTHLNPTYEYGVTFERGVCVDYGDRSHVVISGTASINNKGEIVAPGDIHAQTDRMFENIETLLSEAGAGFNDVAQMIVYLRDIADYQAVNRVFRERFAHIPHVITLAPVCRTGWLVETECIAIKENKDHRFNAL